MTAAPHAAAPDPGERGRVRCLVLGGSGALGGAVVRALASAGARVAFTFHAGRAATERLAVDVPGATAIEADLARVSEAERAVGEAAAALGGLDALVHCAVVGTGHEPEAPGVGRSMQETGEAEWDRVIAVNLKSAYFAARAAAEHLRAAGGGNIVFVGSIDGEKPVPSPVHYAASKAALSGMTRAMAKELGKDRIKVNCVAPGVLDAGLSRLLSDELRREFLKHSAQKRLGRPAEIAAVIDWLARENTYVTAQVIVIDGGL